MQYLNNGVQVNAIQWTGKNKEEVMIFFGDNPATSNPSSANGIYMFYMEQLYLRMANGQLMVQVGEYVVKTPRLTYYPSPVTEFERDHKPIGEQQEKITLEQIPVVDPMDALMKFNSVSIESIETAPIVVSIVEGKYIVMKQGQIHLCFYADQFAMLQKTINQIVNGFFGIEEPTSNEPRMDIDPEAVERQFEWEMENTPDDDPLP